MVEFVLVSGVALLLVLSLVQLGLFLWERNALMGSLSEGARVAATEGRSVADGRRVASELLRQAAGARVADAVPIEGGVAGGVVVLRAEGTLPSFVPGVPGLPVRMTARMHEARPGASDAQVGGRGARLRGIVWRRWWSCWWCSSPCWCRWCT